MSPYALHIKKHGDSAARNPHAFTNYKYVRLGNSIAVCLQDILDLLHVLAVSGFQNEVHHACVDFGLLVLTVVMDGDDIGAGLGNDRQQAVELTGLIHDLRGDVGDGV